MAMEPRDQGMTVDSSSLAGARDQGAEAYVGFSRGREAEEASVDVVKAREVEDAEPEIGV